MRGPQAVPLGVINNNCFTQDLGCGLLMQGSISLDWA